MTALLLSSNIEYLLLFNERLLRQVLGDADVAPDPGQAGDQPRRLDSPNSVDRAVDALLHLAGAHHARSMVPCA
jgi:hypothetical protein